MCWLSHAHNSAVDLTNSKWSQTAYRIEQILSFEINLFPLHFCMEREETKVKGLSEIRFRSVIFLLRLGGIPFKMKEMSPVYVIYMLAVVISTWSTFLGLFVDVYINRGNLAHVVTTVRVLTGTAIALWIYIACR